jgi:3'-phosphoadenosine 5'-phosphosulfate sulfotransferase (PAPS reductase)/FAD synthetase
MQQSERELYFLHSRLPVHQRRIDRSIRIVRDAITQHPINWGVSVSGGKDSIVLAHICAQAGHDGPLFHYHASEIPVENTALVIDLGRQLNREVITKHITGDFDLWQRHGRAIISADTAEDKKIIAQHDRDYRADISRAVADAGIEGLFWGLRMDESRARKMAILRNGIIYRAKTRTEMTCHPLAHWTARDIWAYTLSHGLPYLRRYDAAEDRETERSETTFIFGAGGDGLWGAGQGARLRNSDPVLWARLCLAYPELQIYG